MLMLSQLVSAACANTLSFTSETPLIAQDGVSAGSGITNYGTVNPSATENPKAEVPATDTAKPDTVHWPWMEKEKKENKSGLKFETPEAATSAPSSPAPSTSAAPKPVAKVSMPSKGTPFKLYGRIDQLAGSAGASFPSLKAMVPKMDTRDVKLQAHAANTVFSGSVVKSFPTDFEGNWGGNLQLQVVQIDPSYYVVDPDEAKRTAQALRVGSTGAVNFAFQNSAGGKVSLEPARVMFMVASGDTEVGAQMDKMLGGANSPMGGMLKQMVTSMPVPVMLELGEIDTTANSALGETGVSGNQVRATVLKNEIRQLAPGVLEQQIVTQETTWNKKTGQPRTGYGETVLRFTSRNPQQTYVQAASINYGANKHFMMKTVLGGWVTKGVTMNTNPMGDMSSLQQMMGGQGGQAGQQGGMPQIPGFDPNMLKKMLGQ